MRTLPITLLLALAIPTHAQSTQELNRTPPPQQRIPQQKPEKQSALQGIVLDQEGRPLPAIAIELNNQTTNTSGDGIFRILHLAPGTYTLTLHQKNAPPYTKQNITLNAGEVLSIEIHLPATSPSQSPLPQTQVDLPTENYKELTRRPDADGAIIVPKETPLPTDQQVAQPQRDRWNLPDFPTYHRYNDNSESQFILGHWFDPFNRNILKADKPIFGKTFFAFTGDSITAADARRLPVPAGQSTANPNENGFFGRGAQLFLPQTFRLTFDLFHGDTAAFRPVDWRLRITPAASINYINARENQVVSPDVRAGTTRLDGHVGLQEAFAEIKLHDFGPNYDFANLRVGIQQFVSDFRGFIFADEQPGIRIFGTLRSNRIQYNLAAFDLLEKNTNSGLNTFHRRGREVAIANIYIQDFFIPGYTTQFSYHFARDNASTHYDDNGFLVRPAAIGNVTPHRVDAHYIGWTGDGHLGSINITHALYQALGEDTLNEIAQQRTRINAQLAAVELSKDSDWLRYRTSFLYASGDNNPVNGTARGFSSIVDGVAFAGGEFSFFNREGIPLTRAGVALTAPDSFLPDLRSSKDEGQSNFVNPGLLLYNAGIDADLTPKLKLVVNANFLQFARTQPLTYLLQQNAIRRTIGFDTGIGFIYRPLLSNNITLHTGATALIPGPGLHDIYTSQTLISIFTVLKFQF